MSVTLRPLDRALVDELLTLAVTTATPAETMPPVDGPPGWTGQRREAFLVFYRSKVDGADAPTMYAITVDGELAGMVRLAPRPIPGEYETGIWLAGTHRGRGIAAAAVRAVLAEARRRGADAVVADTTPGNAAALGTLRACGADLWADEATGKVLARFDIGAA